MSLEHQDEDARDRVQYHGREQDEQEPRAQMRMRRRPRPCNLDDLSGSASDDLRHTEIVVSLAVGTGSDEFMRPLRSITATGRKEER